IDFDAAWALPFDPKQTAPGDFHGADGKVTTAPLMHQWAELPYAEGDGWQAIAIPYDGHQLSLLVLLPTLGGLDDFEGRLDGARLASIARSFEIAGVTLTLPKFRLDPGATSLRDRLRDLGMVDAFDGARA